MFAFDAIHDQVDPARVLTRIHDALEPGGMFVMFDIKAASALEDNVGNFFAPSLYGVSTLHCLTVSLAHSGTGLATMWGEQLAVRMLPTPGSSISASTTYPTTRSTPSTSRTTPPDTPTAPRDTWRGPPARRPTTSRPA
jgi:hypothetical protein